MPSCAIGPFIRLFDDGFTLDDVRRADGGLTVEGPTASVLEGKSVHEPDQPRSRRPRRRDHRRAAPVSGRRRAVLGTMFAPVEDRDATGQGFTHKVGDVVTVASPRLGRLSNTVVHSSDAEPWTFGTGALMHNLARRGLVDGEARRPAQGDVPGNAQPGSPGG